LGAPFTQPTEAAGSSIQRTASAIQWGALLHHSAATGARIGSGRHGCLQRCRRQWFATLIGRAEWATMAISGAGKRSVSSLRPGVAAITREFNGLTMFDQIEKLKQRYTDQYVVVDASQPELARFQGFTGRVKTVNMSGRALVEFDAWNNIGWYDIEVDYLK